MLLSYLVIGRVTVSGHIRVYAPLTASVQAKDLVILSWDHTADPNIWFSKKVPIYKVDGVPGVWSYDYLGLSHQVIKLRAVD